MPRDHRYSPAALVLMSAGVTLTRIAEALGTTTTSVSRWLAGEHPAPPEMIGVIAALGGRDLANDVTALVADARADVRVEVPA